MSVILIAMQFVLSILGMIVLIFVVYKNIHNGEYISCKNLFAAFAFVDVFMPAFVGVFTGKYQHFSYFLISDNKMYSYATIIFFVAMFLFEFGWRITFGRNSYIQYEKKIKNNKMQINEILLMGFYLFSILISFLNLYIEFRACGTWEMFYEYKITRAYLVNIEYTSVFESIVHLASEFSISIMFITTSIGFVNYQQLQKKSFWHRWAPAISFFFVLTTLFRGTILAYACMLLVSLQFKNGNDTEIKLSPKIKKRIKKIIVIACIGFVIYGGIRTSLTNERWENQISFSESVLQMISNTFGTTLVALARCLQYIRETKLVFHGRSIYEMFYALVPRSIWIDKPTHYGIVTLTMAMGSPSTTMDAVSIPGELIMNYDLFGLILVPFIGWIFKKYDKIKYSNRYRYIYAATVCTLVTTSMWMSFTGFFAKIKYFPIYFIVCYLIIKRESRSR